MKIKHSKITAASDPKFVKIPSPFNQYYRLLTDEEFEELVGLPAHPSPCEEADGYNIKHYWYCIARPEYERHFEQNGLDIVELVSSDWDPNKEMLAYVVNGNIYPVEESDLPLEGDEETDLHDRDAVMQAIKENLGVDDYDAYDIYDWYEAEGALEDFDNLNDFLSYVDSDIYNMLDAADDQDQADRIREAIEGSTRSDKKAVNCSVDTGLQYWYLTKHGLGPGMMPGDVHLIDVIDDGYDTYVLLDKMLTTDELNYYDMKEQFPPEELLASCSVEGATSEELKKKFDEYSKKQNELGKQLDDLQDSAKKKSGLFSKKKKVESAECKKVSEDKDSIHYVIGSEEERPWWIVDAPIPDDPSFNRRMLDLEIADEEDFYDRIHHEGDYEDDDYNYAADYKSVEGDTDTETDSEKEEVECSADINSIDLDQLKADIVAGCEEYLTGPKGGFLPSGTPKQDKWDMTADEMYIVEVEKNSDNIKVEVRAELDFDGMMNMSEILDDIIRKYDPDAYFDMEEPGIMDAYIEKNSVNGSTNIEASREDDIFREHDAEFAYPEEDYDDDEEMKNIDVDYNFDFVVDVDEEGNWKEDETAENRSEYPDFPEDTLTEDQVDEDSEDIMVWSIPSEAGKYRIKGHMHLEYRPEMNSFGEYRYACNAKNSKVTDLEVVPAGNHEEVESSTEVVEAAMSSEQVEDAILNDKPFDLDSFIEYTGEDHEGEIKAEQLEVGDVFKINNSDIIDYGTVVKVLGINEPELADEAFDYTFRCVIEELPENTLMTKGVGDEVELWFDGPEYVGTLIPR